MDNNEKFSDFRIRNCTAADLEFACPKAWSNMKPAFSAAVRHCDACDRNVYLCRTDKDIELYSSLNYCIAIAATDADGPVPEPPGQTSIEPVDVVARFSGIWRRTPDAEAVLTLEERGMEVHNIPAFLKKNKLS